MTFSVLRDLPSILRRPTTSSDFIPVVDGLRFLAIFPVVLQHLSERVIRVAESLHLATPVDYKLIHLLPSGRLGVELFFVISGLIISYPFVRAHFKQLKRPNLGAFYLRRVTRLEPPYFIVMIACYFFLRATGYVPVGTLSLSRLTNSLEASLAASLVYMHSIVLGTPPALNPPAWSLEIEIQFYLLAPLLIIWILRLRHTFLFIAGLVITAIGSILVSSVLERNFDYWPNFVLTRFLHLFAVGLMVNVLTFGFSPLKLVGERQWDIVFTISAIGLLLLDKGGHSTPALMLQSVCFAVFVLAALNGHIVKKFLSFPWIVAIGGMCYTIYLIHLPILHVLTGIIMKMTGMVTFMLGMLTGIVVLMPILLVASCLFYLSIERPCMNPNWPAILWRRIHGFMTWAR